MAATARYAPRDVLAATVSSSPPPPAAAELLVCALFLLAADAPRLAASLILGRAAAPKEDREPRFERAGTRRAALALKVGFVAYVALATPRDVWRGYHAFGDGAPEGALDGLYEVEAFARDEAPAKREGDAREGLFVDGPIGDGSLALEGRHGAVGSLAYSRPDAEHVELRGSLGGALVSVKLRRADTSRMLLVRRGFRWVNEFPMNH